MAELKSISNIAWPQDDDETALSLAKSLGFTGIELAPVKVFGSLDTVSTAKLRAYREKLDAKGLKIPALQAILFGVNGAHLFKDVEDQKVLAKRLIRVAEVAGELGAAACVFGSPALRDPGDIPEAEALDIATAFFAGVAPRFAEHGTTLAFEANAAIYDCRFITHTHQAISLVERVSHRGFELQLDMGTVFANQEDGDEVTHAGKVASHCHVSEPRLVPVGSGGYDHDMTGAALARSGYSGWVSVEMRASEEWQGAMAKAAQVLSESYRFE